MRNETIKSPIDYFSNKSYELFEQYSEGKLTRTELNVQMLELTDECKIMEKKIVHHSFDQGYNSGNFTTGKLAVDFYKELFGY